MSQLSTAECTAGISRTALAALKKKHNTNGDRPHAPKVPMVPMVAPESAREPFSGQREIRVIDTPFRQLSILESRDGEVTLRNAEFIGSKCDLAIVHLEREQARTLGLTLIKEVHREDA